MSLLLDALKSEPNAALTEPEEEPLDERAPEEPLDAHATLELLIPKLTVNELLTLEPSTDIATAAPPVETPEPVAEIARSPPISARVPLTLAGGTSEPTASQPSAAQASAQTPAPPQAPAQAQAPNARALDTAAPAVNRTKKYGLLLVIVALAGMAVVGKSWWWPSTNAITGPDGGEPQQPVTNADQTPSPSSTRAVQISSARPPDQFVYTGDAPEIDLRATDIHPVITKSRAGEVASTATVISPVSGVSTTATTKSRPGEVPSATTVTSPVSDVSTTATTESRASEVPSTTTVTSPASDVSTTATAKSQTSEVPSTTTVTSPVSDISTTATTNGTASDVSAPRPASDMPPEAAKSARTKTATLSIIRAKGVSPIDVHVQAGYRALASGDIANAENEYLAALELDPNSVDALMGAATAAARDGRPAVAAERYSNVLKLEPGNPDATAAMTMLSRGGATNESQESRLKVLIATDDTGPALHAALATVYATDGRWTEATQEYFTALGKDPGNPDLAFNVAASLDQGRNVAMALNYYQQALTFASQRPSQIDQQAIERRIRQLKTRTEVQASTVPEAP